MVDMSAQPWKKLDRGCAQVTTLADRNVGPNLTLFKPNVEMLKVACPWPTFVLSEH